MYQESSYSFLLAVLFTTVLSGIIFVTGLRRHLNNLPWPPGPRSIPFIGNWMHIPTHTPWVAYDKWSRDHKSDLVSINAFGQAIIFVNTQKAAEALLEERSSIYSDRPFYTIINLSGWDWFVGVLPYSDIWRARRRLVQRTFHEHACKEFRPMQHTVAENLIKWLYKDPGDFEHYTYTAMASLTLSIAYGYDAKPRGDPLLDKLAKAQKIAIDLMIPGTSMLNEIPLLSLLPSWFPGMGYKTRAEACKLLTTEVLHSPLDTVKCSMADGTARGSMASNLLRENEAGGGISEDVIRESVASIYAAGAEATGGVLHIAIHTFVLHPDVQKRAQAELDRVVGRDRLPNLDDRAALPYVGAMFREILRWNTNGPFGIPHRNTQDDVYEGYAIPKGSIIFTNIWAMVHDPELYPDPMSFKPERFLKADGSLNDDDLRLMFGFGRRGCPGKNLASPIMWLTMACMLAVFDFGFAKDADGNDIPVKNEMTDGMSSRPVTFPCSIKPRDALAETLIQSLM